MGWCEALFGLIIICVVCVLWVVLFIVYLCVVGGLFVIYDLR